MKALIVLLLFLCLQQSNGSEKPNQPKGNRTRTVLLTALACCQTLANPSKDSSTSNSICKFNETNDVNPFVNYANQDRPFFLTDAKDVIAFTDCVDQDEKFFDKYLIDAPDYKSCLEKKSILEYPLKFGKKAYDCAKSYLFSGKQAPISQKELFAEYLKVSELEGEALEGLLEKLGKNLEKERVETLEAETKELEKIETQRAEKVKLANMEIEKANQKAENLKKKLEEKRESKFDAFQYRQATKFFSHKFPDNKAAAYYEALKDEYKEVDFGKANRALEYAKELYPNDRSKAIKKALDAKDLQHENFGRLLHHIQKLRPNDEAGAIKLALSHKFSIWLSLTNFDHFDKLWKLYVKHQSFIQDSETDIEKALLATFNTWRLWGFSSKDVDFDVVERLMKIMLQVHPRTQEGYHQANKMALEQYMENEMGRLYGSNKSDGKMITAENIEQVEKTAKMFHELCFNVFQYQTDFKHAQKVYKFAVGTIREDENNSVFKKIEEAYKKTTNEYYLTNWSRRDAFWNEVFGHSYERESFVANYFYEY